MLEMLLNSQNIPPEPSDPYIVPRMTGNEAPAGYRATARTTYNDNRYFPYRSFTRNTTGGNPFGWTSDASASSTGVIDEWLQIELPEVAILRRYAITGSLSGANWLLADYQIQGSNDGVNFDILHTVIDAQQIGLSETVEYNINNELPYRFYRISITKVSNSARARVRLLDLYRTRS